MRGEERAFFRIQRGAAQTEHEALSGGHALFTF